MRQWIQYAIYRGMVEKDYSLIENTLIPLEEWRWQKRLLGCYFQQGKIAEANQILNELPIRTENEIRFKAVQMINIKRFDPTQGVNTITEGELEELAEIAQSPYPASGYARGLYYAVTGNTLPYNLPVMEHQEQTRQWKPIEAINEEVINNKILIYPNPTKDILVIESEENLLHQITIVDLQGNILYINRPNSFNCTVDLENLSNGLYFIRILDANGTIISTRFVKQ